MDWRLRDVNVGLRGGKTFCAIVCASFIAGSRRAFLFVDCVFFCVSFCESSDWDWMKYTRCERFLLVKPFYSRIRGLVQFCPCYWHTLRLGRLWSKSFLGLQLVVILLMYPAGGESYQTFAVGLLTVLSFWKIWADFSAETFFGSREKCTHFISASFNRPFPSSPWPLFQNEGRCSAFDLEIIFHSHTNKTHFHKKGCAPSLILKVRVFRTRKWPIKSTCQQKNITLNATVGTRKYCTFFFLFIEFVLCF